MQQFWNLCPCLALCYACLTDFSFLVNIQAQLLPTIPLIAELYIIILCCLQLIRMLLLLQTHDCDVLTGIFTLLSCCTSERWLPLFTNTTRGTEQGITRGPFTLLPLGKVHTMHNNDPNMIFICNSLWLMSGFFTQNRSNTLTLPIQCTVNVASYRETAVRIAGTLRIDTLHAVSLKLKTCMQKSGDIADLWLHSHACSYSINLVVFYFESAVVTAL